MITVLELMEEDEKYITASVRFLKKNVCWEQDFVTRAM